MANVLRNSTLLEISIVDKGASGDGEDRPRIVIAKRDMEKAMPDLQPVLEKLSPEDQAVVMAAIEAAAAPAEPMPEPAPEPAMPEKQEETTPEAPAMNPEEEKPVEVAKALESVSDEDRAMVLEAIEKRDILEKRVAELEAEKDKAKFQEIAKSMDALPGMKTDDRAELLRVVSKAVDEQTYSKIETQMREAADLIAKSASMGEIGSAAPVDPADARGRLEAIAKSIREKNPELSAAQAKVKAAEQNPDLYKETTAK